MTDEIRNNVISELSGDFTSEQLREIDLAVAKALQGYQITKSETLPTVYDDTYPVEVKEFFARKRVKGCSEKTLKLYEFTLNRFIQWAPKDLKEMTDLDILIYLDFLQTNTHASNRTLDNNRLILSSFYTFLYDTGRIPKNPVKAIDPIKCKSKVREPLTDMEMEKVRNACQTEKERALVETLYSTGARVSEIVSLNRDDIDMINRRAIITGKGNKERYIFFNAKSLYAIQRYLETRTDSNPALFVMSRAPHTRITASGVEFIIKNIGKRAELGRTLFPHIFRHTFATDMLANGAPIDEVSKLLGHEKIDTTEIYAKSSVEMLADAHKRCIA
ncbi:MAG: tyrosine-type recombinase/integrase [Bacteroidales bacterium]|nr:tyrosine-type recombinase/integrase [Bacteroidales bacterium]